MGELGGWLVEVVMGRAGLFGWNSVPLKLKAKDVPLAERSSANCKSLVFTARVLVLGG